MRRTVERIPHASRASRRRNRRTPDLSPTPSASNADFGWVAIAMFGNAMFAAPRLALAMPSPNASPLPFPIKSAKSSPRHAKPRRHPTRNLSKGRKVLAAFLGVALVGGGAYAATNWVVGLVAGSSGQGQSATVQNLTITAVATPAATNLLYPGGTGDVVITISNPNPYPVTVTGVDLPSNTTYATGYTSSSLLTTETGCIASSPSDVIWAFTTSSSGTAHTLTTPVTVGPSGNSNNPLTVTLTNDASMTAAAPAACENTYFSMPSLTGIAATGGSASVTSSPVTDAWTS